MSPILASAPAASTTLTIEVVDDTGQPNAPYVLLVGKSVTAGQAAAAVAAPMSVDPGLGQLAQTAADAPYVPATVTATLSSGTVVLQLGDGGSGYQSIAGAPIPVSLVGGTADAANVAQAIATFGPLAITVSEGGSGYTSAPSVTLSGGGGSGATAIAAIAGGAVTTIAVTNPGSGYTSAPLVTLAGGGGSGASATAAFGAATLQSITLLAGGAGYAAAPTVTISGGGGSGAAAMAAVNGGAVTAITLTDAGKGYTSAPTVTLTGGGATAAATAIAVFGRSVAGITVIDPGSGYTAMPVVSVPNSINPLPADLLAPTGTSLVSSYTGQTRTVRSFDVTTLGSGAFLVFANDGSGTPPFTYSDNANPTTGAAFRFDQCEITFDAAIQSGANLTSINALSMPMKFELFNVAGGQRTLVDDRTFYASLSNILGQFPSSLSGALYRQGPTGPVGGWTPSDGMTGFLRALGPGEAAAVSGSNLTGSPAPYSSFASYLASLAALAPTTAATAAATIAGGSVASVAVANVGTGYTSPPAVSFTGGGGSGAAGYATLNADNVVGVTVTSGGSGYTTPPAVMFSAGGGAGAAATAQVAGGSLTGVTLSAGGSGYLSAPTVAFTGGGGKGATGVATLSGGQVSGVTVTNAGSGYSSAPTVAFTPGAGSGAAANASIATGLSGLTLTGGGAGYTSAPAVTITGGGGFGATAIATIDQTGAVSALTLTGAGSGYTSAPAVNFSAFNVSGSSNGSDYNYAGDVLAVSNGYQVVLNGTTFAANTGSPFAGAGLPAGATVTVNLPATLVQATATATVDAGGTVTGVTVTNGGRGYLSPPLVIIASPSGSGSVTATATASLSGDSVGAITVQSAGSGYSAASAPLVTVSQPAGSMDTFIYGATLSGDSFGVSGLSAAQVAANTNIVYGAIARDALAALNFGYIGGNWGNTGQQWFGAPPSSYPFGLARPAKDDGYYNSYAALLYNTSDAYGFAFSDRINPSPLITLNAGQVLRITLLPDAWGIDAPQPSLTAGSAADTSFGLQWPAVAGATGYQITVLDPPGLAPVEVPASSGGTVTATLGKDAPLNPGTPYIVTVTALGKAPGAGAVSAASLPLQIGTTGTPATVSGTATFVMTFGFVPAPFLLDGTGQLTGLIAGQPIAYNQASQQWQVADGGSGVALQAAEGTNVYPFTLSNESGALIFAGNAVVTNQGGSLTGAYYKGGTLSVAGSGPGTVMSIILPPPSPLKAVAPVVF